MTDEEIAVRLSAAILTPSVALPSKFANIFAADDQIKKAAQLSVRVYRVMLATLKEPEPDPA